MGSVSVSSRNPFKTPGGSRSNLYTVEEKKKRGARWKAKPRYSTGGVDKTKEKKTMKDVKRYYMLKLLSQPAIRPWNKKGMSSSKRYRRPCRRPVRSMTSGFLALAHLALFCIVPENRGRAG